jgi:hypothetical protein
MYFLCRHHLPPDKLENDQDDSDWLTYSIDIWLLTLLFSLQYLSESCFRNDVLFFNLSNLVASPDLERRGGGGGGGGGGRPLPGNATDPTFYSLKIFFTQPLIFSSMPPQAKNNHRSLMGIEADLASFARGGGGFPEGVHCYGAFSPGKYFSIWRPDCHFLHSAHYIYLLNLSSQYCISGKNYSTIF